MSDLRDLPDLVGDVRERVVVPPYAEVSRRVRARRARTAAGTFAAVALVAGGVAVWQDVATTAGPSVPQPADTQGPTPPTDESQWRAVVEGADAHPFEIEGTDDGSIAVVWRALEHPEPTFALVIREADGTVHGRRLDEPLELTPVHGGWVGVRTAQGFFIGSDGTWTDLGEPGPPRPARPGDVFVRGQYGISRLYSPVDNAWAATPAAYGDVADGFVMSDGGVVTCGHTGGGEIAVHTSDRLLPRMPGETCVVAGRGDDLAFVALGDEPDGSVPMTGLMTRIDLTWTFPRMTDPLDGVTSVVVTPGGSTVITDASDGRWFLVRPDGEVTEPDRKLGEAFVAGLRLYASSYGFMDGPLFVSDDDGITWEETPLPGKESSED